MNTKKHEEQCGVCNSTKRKEIEERYLEWTSPESLENDYPPLSAWTIRNHCKAFGLDVKRNTNLKGACIAVMERGFTCLKNSPVDAHAIIKAANLHGKLNDAGQVIDKTEHSGKVKTEIDVSKEVSKRIDNLINAIGGVPDVDDSVSQ